MFDALTALCPEPVCRVLLVGLGQALVLGTMLAVLTWTLLRILRRRTPFTLEMILWCVVLLRFVVPSAPGWSGSLANLCTIAVPAPQRTALVSESLPGFPQTPTLVGTDNGGLAASSGSANRPGWATISTVAYAAVLLGLAVTRTTCYRRFRAACLALPPADADTRRIVHTVCDHLRMRYVPLVRISDDDHAPFVMGLIRPLLVLSRRQLVRPDELETVIVHEVTHLRRGDMLVRCVQCVAGLFFFFWPVVAWVNRRIDRAREHACDEWALRRGKLTPGQYARCLLEAARLRRPALWAYAPAYMAGHPSTIERRIDVILTLPNRPPRGTWGRLGAAAFLLVWCGFTLAGPAQPAAAPPPAYEPTEAGMRQHAQVVFDLVKSLPGGDVNADGQVTKDECWAFVAAVVLEQPAAVLQEYPWADRNRDHQLEFEEAFLFARGDYDLQDLHEKLGPEKKLVTGGQEAEQQEFKKKAMTAEFATWHVILDRRAALITSAKKIPAPQVVRDVFENKMPALLRDAEFEQFASKISELAELAKQAQELRTKAAEPGAAAPDLLAKATQLEQKAAEYRVKLRTAITDTQAEFTAQGKTAEAARLQELLQKLESL